MTTVPHIFQHLLKYVQKKKALFMLKKYSTKK